MSERARLRSEISARKFQVMDLEINIGRRVQEIRDLIGTRLTKNESLNLRLISILAGEAFEMQKQQADLAAEIELGEKELNG